ncbi:MAG: hypothetical protein AB1716_05345 [Planctomycetota bacterium]
MSTACDLLVEHRRTCDTAADAIFAALRSEFAACCDDGLRRTQLGTRSLLTWIAEHVKHLQHASTLCCRKVLPPVADEFTPALATVLEAFLAASGLPGRVQSEVRVVRRRGQQRPDITVWCSPGKPAAIIECKTNLGYNRDGWRAQYEQRLAALRDLKINCPVYLCVLTQRNWETSWTRFANSEHYQREWICLTARWPGEISSPAAEGDILVPIEPMLTQIRARLRDSA